MRRFTLVAVLALLAGPVEGADTKPATGTGASQKQKAKPPTREQVIAVTNAKAGLMAAVRACVRPDTCDPKSSSANPDLVSLLASKDSAFIDACVACAPREACEQERDKILEGRAGHQAKHPCTPPAK